MFLQRVDPIPGHDLPLGGYATTLIGHTTLGMIPLDEWSVRREDLYLTTDNTHKKDTFTPAAGFEPTIP
jgi:hypothetical protein